jgi:hypothetical protein
MRKNTPLRLMFADCCGKETTGGSITCDAMPPVE